MVWTTIPNGDIDADSPITTSLMTALRDNVTAIANGDAGAPAIQTAAYASGSVDQAAIGASAVGQSELKTTTGEVSASALTRLTLPGGSYGFYPRTRDSVGGQALIRIAYQSIGSSFVTNISIQSSSGTAFAEQRYIQASPPYNLGDGDVPLFIFVIVDSLGNAENVYVAPEAPWHYNGHTSIVASRKEGVRSWKEVPQIIKDLNDAGLTKQEAVRDGVYTRETIADRLINDAKVEMEITQTIKQADMNVIPHPFISNDLRGKTIVMLDPVSVSTEKLLKLHNEGESIAELISTGKITFGNTPLSRVTPSGVIAVDFTL